MTEDNQQDVGELIDTQISQGGLLLGVENDAKENDENSDATNNSGGSEDDSDEEDRAPSHQLVSEDSFITKGDVEELRQIQHAAKLRDINYFGD